MSVSSYGSLSTQLNRINISGNNSFHDCISLSQFVEYMDIRNYFGNSAPQAAQPVRHTLDKECYIIAGNLPAELSSDFSDLWNLHPDDFGTVVMYGKQLKTPRWQQSYIRAYTFSGECHESLPLPEQFQPFLDWANAQTAGQDYNSCLVNWYENGEHYIGPHRDDERELIKNSEIMSISLGAERIFRIRDYATKGDQYKQDIIVRDKTYLIMCGRMQQRFTHEIVKVSGNRGKQCGKRINITFRKMK